MESLLNTIATFKARIVSHQSPKSNDIWIHFMYKSMKNLLHLSFIDTFYPLRLDISAHFIHTVLYMSLIVLARIICLTGSSSFSG